MEKPHRLQGSEALIQGVQLHRWSLVVECPVLDSEISVQILTFGKPPISIAAILSNIHENKLVVGIHKCHQINRKCSFVIVKQTSTIEWCSDYNMLAIQGTETVRKIPPVCKLTFYLFPSLLCRGQHFFIHKTVPNSLASISHNVMNCARSHSEPVCKTSK